MEVTLIDVMGDDLTVVNAARVSFAKVHDELDGSDLKLLKYLAEHGHWSPFAHPQLSFQISTSIAVARQLFRHQVGLTVNETSRRYVKDTPTFDLPKEWRMAPAKGQSKQGSGKAIDTGISMYTDWIVQDIMSQCSDAYHILLEQGIAPEQARLVLPMATTTEWVWTGSLMAFIRVCKDRLAPDAQRETAEVAQSIAQVVKEHFPHSWEAWGMEEVC